MVTGKKLGLVRGLSLFGVLSTLAALGTAGCGDDSCDEGGRKYAEDANWTCSDGCNSCTCHGGTVTSTLIGCPTPPGPAAGKLQCFDKEWYQTGRTWQCAAGCCTCDDGHVLTSPAGGC